MNRLKYQAALMAGAAYGLLAVTGVLAGEFNIPGGDLKAALDAYTRQAGVPLVYSGTAVKGARTQGVKGDLSSDDALAKLLSGTGFVPRRNTDSAITIVHSPSESRADEGVQSLQLAQAASPPRPTVETVTVTSSKLGGADVQSIPIAITALSQEQLTSRQVAGGPDLVKEIPNLTFSKTNFTGYNIQIRGIGTQAISVTTDPAVAVALNDIPFIRNHFFEQEFYDVGQVEVLRGPQGTLYGRNATAGVVNVISAKPTDQFEAMASADIGNYHNRRFEGTVNLPIVDDRLDLRVAGEWTKRDGYSTNEITGDPIDGRDLWSSRVTLQFKPSSNLQVDLVWEHFQENDDRMRTAKQLCKTDHPPASVDGVPIAPGVGGEDALSDGLTQTYLSQGCLPTSLYSSNAFEVPYGFSLPYVVAAGLTSAVDPLVDPYASTTQSRNLRVIESNLNPHYEAKNDTLELNADYAITPALTFTSQTGYNQDFLYSTEDYNRFNTTPDIFLSNGGSNNSLIIPDGNYRCSDGTLSIGGQQACAIPSGNIPTGSFCDPQLGCSTRFVAGDLSDEHAWQLSQEFRLTSNFSGPLNFSVGGNYLHYETEENYYVFINGLSIYSVYYGDVAHGLPYVPGVTSNSDCLSITDGTPPGYQDPNPVRGGGEPTQSCVYIDPNPVSSLNNEGHNYFLSQNPYNLNSYAAFGEVYYTLTNDLKLTGGLRWTDDNKRFIDLPSEVISRGYGYYDTGTVNQKWEKFTGRAAVNWTPKLDFTDQTLVYGSYAHGYKAGGANPPGAVLLQFSGNSDGEVSEPIHPLTFRPEFIDAFELGSKNTMLDGALTLNGDVFYYDYKGYQISEIVDRTSINLNFDAKVDGAELETSWEPAPGLKFSFAGGYEHTRIDDGQSAIDLMDRTAGTPGWIVVKPFPTQASNCILPAYVVPAENAVERAPLATPKAFACEIAYSQGLDPVTDATYMQTPAVVDGNTGNPYPYPGFDPLSSDPNAPANVNNGLGLPPNNGEGFAKKLGGNELPNAPRFTVSASADYTIPVTADWASTFHIDYYWQDYSWARVFNDNPYDRLRGYTNVNLALILTSQSGWQVMGYLKNVFNTTDITGDFLNSDDSGLTTNVFLTDPRLFGVRVTKNW